MSLLSPMLLPAWMATLVALIGGFVSVGVGLSHRRLCILISFSAGVFLATTVTHILPEALTGLGWLAVGAMASGYLVLFAVGKVIFHVCPACAATHFDEQMVKRFKEIAWLLVVALGIHSTLDGLALSVSSHVSDPANLATLLAISIHKFPEGLALTAVILRAGYARWFSLLITGVIELTTLLGGAIGLVTFQGVSPAWVQAAMAFTGGNFIYLALHAIGGELLQHERTLVLSSTATGFGGMVLVRWLS